MKSILAVVLFAFALSFCNLMGRRGNENANPNSPPSAGQIAESSPTPGEVPPPPPAPTATVGVRTLNRNTNASPQLDLRAAPPGSAPGAPSTSMPGTNHNSAASVPPPPRAPISGGVLNGKAISLPKPAYPAIAKAANVSGAVNVQVTLDESGNVISASAVSGHPLLRQSAVNAARQAKFRPTMLSGQPVKVTGVIIYNFVMQ